MDAVVLYLLGRGTAEVGSFRGRQAIGHRPVGTLVIDAAALFAIGVATEGDAHNETPD
jgi:hypothetical protein